MPTPRSTQRRSLFRGSICGLTSALLLTVVFTAHAPQSQTVLQIVPTTVRQGQVITITLPAAEPYVRRTLRFAGRSWPLYHRSPFWETYLGTDPTTRPGRYVVTFDAVAGQGTHLAARGTVTVVGVAFPTRRLTFDRGHQALLTPAAAEVERTRTEAALRTLHGEQLWEGQFLLPVAGPVISPYGVLSIYQGQVWGFHRGVDIAAPAGTPIQAANDGIVRLAEHLPLSGNAILIDHGLGVVSTYFHLSAIHVHAGQGVKKGEVLGAVGTTGLSLGPHLHWGLWVNGVYVDPLPWANR